MLKNSDPPDPDRCKTIHVFADYWECQADHAGFCRYALPLRESFYCQHPESWSFTKEC